MVADTLSVSPGGSGATLAEYEIHDDSHSQFRVVQRTTLNLSIASISLDDERQLPTIKVLGTGGTIALKGSTGSQTAGYKVDLTIEELVALIPDLTLTANLEYEQVFNVDSKEINSDELLQLYQKVKEGLKEYDGIVITHGTDTMEETAFFLQCAINTDKPIVLCGLMRPSTAILSDGPMNLYQAISIASDPSSRGRGVLVALNDRIGSGFYITKLNANSLDTFKLAGQGYLGNFVNNEVHYYYPPSKPLGLVYFDVDPFDAPEDVVILYGHQGISNRVIELILSGLACLGLVLATMGAGLMADATNDFIATLTRKLQIPVVYLKRLMDGMVPTAAIPRHATNRATGEVFPYTNAIAGGYLNPQKARILVQLCLAQNMDIAAIRKVFQQMYGG